MHAWSKKKVNIINSIDGDTTNRSNLNESLSCRFRRAFSLSHRRRKSRCCCFTSSSFSNACCAALASKATNTRIESIFLRKKKKLTTHIKAENLYLIRMKIRRLLALHELSSRKWARFDLRSCSCALTRKNEEVWLNWIQPSLFDHYFVVSPVIFIPLVDALIARNLRLISEESVYSNTHKSRGDIGCFSSHEACSKSIRNVTFTSDSPLPCLLRRVMDDSDANTSSVQRWLMVIVRRYRRTIRWSNPLRLHRRRECIAYHTRVENAHSQLGRFQLEKEENTR